MKLALALLSLLCLASCTSTGREPYLREMPRGISGVDQAYVVGDAAFVDQCPTADDPCRHLGIRVAPPNGQLAQLGETILQDDSRLTVFRHGWNVVGRLCPVTVACFWLKPIAGVMDLGDELLEFIVRAFTDHPEAVRNAYFANRLFKKLEREGHLSQ